MGPFADVAKALGALSDDDLDGLCNGIAVAPDVMAGLAAWIKHACNWEKARRVGCHYHLYGPSSEIDQDEINLALVALAVLTEGFRDRREQQSEKVAAFLEIAAATLRAEIEARGVLQ
jgi:hypothetical protein